MDEKAGCLEVPKYFGTQLYSDAGYDFEVIAKSELGVSLPSETINRRTEKKPSAASALIDYYLKDYKVPKKTEKDAQSLKCQPWEVLDGYKKWEHNDDTLFLGFRTTAVRRLSDCDLGHSKSNSLEGKFLKFLTK